MLSLKDIDLWLVTLCRFYAAFTRSRLTSLKDNDSCSWLILIWLRLSAFYVSRYDFWLVNDVVNHNGVQFKP